MILHRYSVLSDNLFYTRVLKNNPCRQSKHDIWSKTSTFNKYVEILKKLKINYRYLLQTKFSYIILMEWYFWFHLPLMIIIVGPKFRRSSMLCNNNSLFGYILLFYYSIRNINIIKLSNWLTSGIFFSTSLFRYKII